MTVKEVGHRAGIVIETARSDGVPTGNVYKVSGWNHDRTKVIAWKQYRQGKTELHPSVRCRVLDTAFSGQYGPF